MKALAWGLVALAGVQATADAPFDADGYRSGRYRAVVDRPVPGVARIDTEGVARLIARERAILVDVLPAEGGHFDRDTRRWRLTVPRPSLPGAHWFPEAGRGNLDPKVAAWLTGRVAALAAARPRATVIVYCLADCWMSWNAALRLRRAGITRVRWYAEGTDGWREAGRTLVEVAPEAGL